MITLRSEGLRPELLEPDSFPSRLGAPLDVAAGTATTFVDLNVLVIGVPLTEVTTVFIITMLVTGLVEAGDTGPGVVEGPCEEEIISVALWVSAVDAGCDSVSGLSLDAEVDEGSSSGGDVEVDTELGLSDVAGDDSGVSLASVEEIILVGASEDVGMDEADVGLAETPVPLGTICRYRSA